ncbi:hypothetical protein [Pseudodesulfovibrio profundus]|nr:hypothetical protein [Pseudodesulfovibrio profundus]
MKDDSQIKFLSVNFYFLKEVDPVKHMKPCLRLKVDKLDHLVQDLALLNNLSPHHLDEGNRYHQEHDSSFDPADYDGVLGDKAIAAMQYMSDSQRQEDLLGVIDFNFGMFETLMSGYETHEDYLKNLKQELYKIHRRQILGLPSCVALGSPPLKQGDSSDFKERIEQKLKKQMAKYRLQKPLLHPISCTIIVIQPDETQYAGKQKDIDNYAFHFILPTVHQELAPLTTLGGIFNDTYLHSEDFEGFPPQKGLPKSVLQYTIIEIPRLNDDPKEGSVFMFLGKGRFHECYWKELDHKIDKALEGDGLY